MPVKKLLKGDNLEHLRKMADASVDLVVLDPPYEITEKMTYTPPALDTSEVGNFEDLWRRKNSIGAGERSNLRAYDKNFPRLMLGFERSHSEAMQKFQEFLAIRLIEIHRVMKPGSSMYFQARSRGAHYSKITLDWIFGSQNFRNQIVWICPSPYPVSGTQELNDTHETILHYSKGDPKTRKDIERERDNGNTWYVEEGFNRSLKTDTPVEIYERMIERSSVPGDLLLDPFAGGGSSLVAAELHERQWIGIEQWVGAARYLKRRFREQLGKDNPDFAIE